jgi:hypothetical protein
MNAENDLSVNHTTRLIKHNILVDSQIWIDTFTRPYSSGRGIVGDDFNVEPVSEENLGSYEPTEARAEDTHVRHQI